MSTIDVTQAGEFIELPEAAEMTARYRNSKSEGEPNACLFNKELVLAMLEDPDCAGLRVYFARNADEQLSMVLVGANAVGEDLFENPMVNRPLFCPPHCPKSSPLQ